MGFDVYLKWDGMTRVDEDAQITGYSLVHGHIGYLRWSYEEPNPVLALLDPFMGDDYPAEISVPNAKLINRLPYVLGALGDFFEDEGLDRIFKSFQDFVKLHGGKEGLGLNPSIKVR